MKFCKKYRDYMQKQHQKQLPQVGFKKLKKVLKRCRRDFQTQAGKSGSVTASPKCSVYCSVCDGTFFPSLMQEMSAVVGCFNERAQKLLELHLASGFRKCFLLFRSRLRGNHVALIEEGKDLVAYAVINAIAIRKILKKYDKVHFSKQGQAFKSQAQRMHVEILQSPWLCELMAFHINMGASKEGNISVPGLFEDCSLKLDGGKPSLSCALFDSLKVDIDLTCSICLEMVFDPISLTCGHIFCFMCACSAASLTTIDGLQAAESKSKCPICRQRRVYEGAIHLEELNLLLSRRCHEYWEERSQRERKERMKQVKEYWKSQTRMFTGI